MEFTRHAQARMQQRGIRDTDVHYLLNYGKIEYDHHGSRVLYLDHAARRRIGAAAGSRAAERMSGLYAVVASDGAVLTVGHRTRRIRRR
jgi:hypothetical protein